MDPKLTQTDKLLSLGRFQQQENRLAKLQLYIAKKSKDMTKNGISGKKIIFWEWKKENLNRILTKTCFTYTFGKISTKSKLGSNFPSSFYAPFPKEAQTLKDELHCT